MSSAPSDPSLSSVPNFLRSGSLGGGGPFVSGFGSSMALPFENSPTSARLPNIVLARLLNQLPLFLRSRMFGRGVGPSDEFCGLVGRLFRRLSDEEAERKPKKRRTDEGRLLLLTLPAVGVGLNTFFEPGEPGLVLTVATLSVRPRVSPLTGPPVWLELSLELCLGFVEAMGSSEWLSWGDVGCDESGPRPGVGGRPGVAGGDSGGAGISVPAVRENSMGLISSGTKAGLLVVEGAMVEFGWWRGQQLQLGSWDDGSGV